MGILSKLYTAERANEYSDSDNPVFMRQLFAYETAAKEVYGSILEIGCGEGYGIKLLAPKAERYIAIDRHIPENQKNFEHIDFRQIEVPFLTGLDENQFDVVICFQLIEHIQDDRTLLQEIFRVLNPGGRLLLTTPNKTMSLSRNPYHVREYETYEFRSLISNYFNPEKVFFGGVYGDDVFMEYHKQNKASVERFRKWDVFKLEHRLPASWFQLPYDILNRINRKKLKSGNDSLVTTISTSNFSIKEMDGSQLDYYCRAIK